MSEILEKCCIPPRLTAKCATANESGGISRIIFAACDVNFNDINNVAEWCYLVKQGKIIVTNEILGKKDKANYTTKMVSSCRPEVVTGKTNTVTYTDYLLDNQEHRDVKFYNTIQKNARHYKLGFIKCDGKFYGLIDKFSVKIDKVIEDTVNDCTYWDIELTWNGLESLNPIYIPNLLEYLNAQCQDVANFEIENIYQDNDFFDMLNYPNVDLGVQGITNFDNIFNGLKVNGVFEATVCEDGFFNINAPFVLGATYYYGNIYLNPFFDIDTGLLVNYVGSPIVSSNENIFIEYNPYPVDVDNFSVAKSTYSVFKYVAIRDYDIQGINQSLTDFIPGTDGVNYLYLYSIIDKRPKLTVSTIAVGDYDSSYNQIDGIYSIGNCYLNGYNITVRDYGVSINVPTIEGYLGGPSLPLEYQLQINGIPSNWIDVPQAGFSITVPMGNHILILQNTINGCRNVIPFTANCS